MSKSLKAALLSALVFPGCGHFSLKKPVQGSLLAFISIICIYVLFSSMMEIAQDISLQVQSGQIPLDMANLNELVLKEFNTNDTAEMTTSSYILGISWLVGIIDSFRIGRIQE
tara:strand:+ start:4086 stop:4424 length:339 start_codon:yes stop_codon:yes gene_type:complete